MVLPLRNEPGWDEGFPSYLRRTAHTLRTTPRELSTSLGLTTAQTRGIQLDAETTSRIAEQLNLRPRDITGAHAQRWHPDVLNLDDLQLPHRIDQPWIDLFHTKFCPSWLQEDEAWRLEWKLPWICTCDEHAVWLHDRCAHCGHPQRDDAATTSPSPPTSCRSCSQRLDNAPTEDAPLDSVLRTIQAKGVLTMDDCYVAGFQTTPVTAVKGWRQAVASTDCFAADRDPIEHWPAQQADQALADAWPLIDARDPEDAAAIVRRWSIAYQRPWPYGPTQTALFVEPLRHVLDDVRAAWTSKSSTRH